MLGRQKWTICPKCAGKSKLGNRFCEHCGARFHRYVTETKCTCSACGTIWFYGKQDVTDVKLAALSNASKGLMCCGGCVPAILIPDKKITPLGKCPKCGSTAVAREQVTHEV